MPRAPRKILITELANGRYCFQPMVQSTSRRPREFEDRATMLEHLWQLLTITEEQWLLEYVPQDAQS
jgi:hypothetical protein